MSTPAAAAPAPAGSNVKGSEGEFKRKESAFRNWITADGEFKPEAGRYHLYVSFACPWAHRTLIVRALKGLEKVISLSAVGSLGEKGWAFDKEKDPLFGFEILRQLYNHCAPDYTGNITVPVLFDKQTKRIVNNESSEIIQMLNSQFNAFSATPAQASLDLYPPSLKNEIDSVNEWIYPQINNGVYRCGFATEQGPYDAAFTLLFDGLDRVEAMLAQRRYLNSDSQLTLADVRLFTTLIRFDTVYHGHFKCNKRKLIEYPNLYGYMKELYQMPAIRATVDHQTIKEIYYAQRKINPTGVIARGPPLEELDRPHGREKVGAKL